MHPHGGARLDRAERRQRAEGESLAIAPREAVEIRNEFDVDDRPVFPRAATNTQEQVGAAREGGGGVTFRGEDAVGFAQGRGFVDGEAHHVSYGGTINHHTGHNGIATRRRQP